MAQQKHHTIKRVSGHTFADLENHIAPRRYHDSMAYVNGVLIPKPSRAVPTTVKRSVRQLEQEFFNLDFVGGVQ